MPLSLDRVVRQRQALRSKHARRARLSGTGHDKFWTLKMTRAPRPPQWLEVNDGERRGHLLSSNRCQTVSNDYTARARIGARRADATTRDSGKPVSEPLAKYADNAIAKVTLSGGLSYFFQKMKSGTSTLARVRTNTETFLGTLALRRSTSS